MSDLIRTQLQTAGSATILQVTLAELVAACMDLGISTRDVVVNGRMTVLPDAS